MYHYIIVSYLQHSNMGFATQLIEDLTDHLINTRDALLDEAVDAYARIVDDYASVVIASQKDIASRAGRETGLRNRFMHRHTNLDPAASLHNTIRLVE